MEAALEKDIERVLSAGRLCIEVKTSDDRFHLDVDPQQLIHQAIAERLGSEGQLLVVRHGGEAISGTVAENGLQDGARLTVQVISEDVQATAHRLFRAFSHERGVMDHEQITTFVGILKPNQPVDSYKVMSVWDANNDGWVSEPEFCTRFTQIVGRLRDPAPIMGMLEEEAARLTMAAQPDWSLEQILAELTQAWRGCTTQHTLRHALEWDYYGRDRINQLPAKGVPVDLTMGPEHVVLPGSLLNQTCYPYSFLPGDSAVFHLPAVLRTVLSEPEDQWEWQINTLEMLFHPPRSRRDFALLTVEQRTTAIAVLCLLSTRIKEACEKGDWGGPSIRYYGHTPPWFSLLDMADSLAAV